MVRAAFGSAVFFCILLAGCGGSNSPSSGTPAPGPTPAATKIKHVIVILQENRTVDNLFNGFPGADTVQSGMSNGKSVPLQPVPLDQGSDLDHSHSGWWKDWDQGKMDGFGIDALAAVAEPVFLSESIVRVSE